MLIDLLLRVTGVVAELTALPCPAGVYVAHTQQLTAAAVKDVAEPE